MIVRVIVILILMGSCIDIATSAASSDRTTISLKEAVEKSYRDNLDLQAARAKQEAVKKDYYIARSHFLPRINLEQTLVRTDQPVGVFGTKLNQGFIKESDFNPVLLNDPDTVLDYGTAVVVSQPIYNGGQELLGLKYARTGIDRIQAETRIAEEQILFETVKDYLVAVLAREGLAVANESLSTATKNLEMVQHKFDQGLVVKSDVLQAEVHVSEIKERKVNASHNLKLSLATLNAILGNPGGAYYPSDELQEGNCPDVPLKTLVSWALKDRPEIQILESALRSADLDQQMARSAFLPNINARGAYEYHGKPPWH
jgi:outer membrane protein TolC